MVGRKDKLLCAKNYDPAQKPPQKQNKNKDSAIYANISKAEPNMVEFLSFPMARIQCNDPFWQSKKNTLENNTCSFITGTKHH